MDKHYNKRKLILTLILQNEIESIKLPIELRLILYKEIKEQIDSG